MTAGRRPGISALGLLLAACSAAPSAVGAYPDHVVRIDPVLLAGSWACRDILPPSDRERLLELRADHGLVRALLPKNPTDPREARDRVDGEWQIVASWVQTTDLHPVSDTEGGLGGWLASLVTEAPPLALTPRTLNVLELDRQRLVFRDVNKDSNPVIGCRRLPPGDPA